jgi:dihydrofolate reductase
LAGDQGAGGGVIAPIALIAAVARNRVIGVANGLPWRLSSDLRRFKALTMGKPLIMGRKTFASVGKALPGRFSIVVTRDAGFASDGVEVAHDLVAALTLARAHDPAEIMIGGGAEIYAQTIGMADRLYITEVGLEPEGDALFPPIAPAEWREVLREPGERGPKDEAEFAFVDYERVSARSPL